MDTTKTVTHIGLCAGYGGIELGLQRVIPDLRSVALCEIEAFAIANLVAKMEAGQMDPAPLWTNLKTFPWAEFRGRVDILTGGYPCQPFSAAGQRRGKDDPRHLWPYIAEGIRLLQPRLCFFENVEGHISLGLSDVIEDLAGMGYRTTWGLFSASECGAPHQRKRVFILANRDGQRGQLQDWWRLAAEQLPVSNGEERRDEQLADAQCVRSNPRRNDSGCSQIPESKHRDSWPSRPGQPQHRWEPPRVVANSVSNGSGLQENFIQYAGPPPTPDVPVGQAQPALGGDTDGPSGGMDYAKLCVSCDNRTDELRLLGNGVVPATAELAFRTLLPELIENAFRYSEST